MNEVALHGFAKMIREGTTPSASTLVISPLEAQSKPAPSAANKRRMYGSGFDFIAEEWCKAELEFSKKRETYQKKVQFQVDNASSAATEGKPD